MIRLPSLSSRATGLLCLAATSLGWGVNWPAVKLLILEWPPLFARGLSGLTAALIIAVFARLFGQSLQVPRHLVGRLVLAAFTNIFAWMGFATLALRWLSAGQGALLVYTMPVWATLLAWPILGKRPTPLAMAGLILCITGMSVLFGGQEMSFAAGKLPGILLALGSAFLFALGTVASKPLPLPPLTALAWQLAIGCFPMMMAGLLFEEPDFWALSRVGLAVMTYMTLVPMGICYLTWFAALRRLPPATASVATLMTPVIGVMAAAWVLGEPLGIREIAALALTLGGVALVMRRSEV